ncbi:MAG: response regulator transcription factor [Lachnospiraceae bacterium]|nr:response regulator transcription factor [Lachnospiraceae bacterium]
MKKILVIEADAKLAERLCRALRDIDTRVFSCGTLEAATASLENELYQQIIIDTELPDGDGYDLIYELGLGIYDSSSAPIILIASNGSQIDMSELGKQGISDYITKPFNISVLKAKVCTQFKRQTREFSLRAISRFEAIGAGSRSSIIGEHVVEIDAYIFNFDMGEFTVAGERVRLNRFEQCLLRNLVENKGVVLKKKALVDKLRMETRVRGIDEMLLTEAVHMLSNKLSAQNYIKTVYGIGYLWTMAEDKNKSG